jgi:hypothetical protein
VCPLKKKIPRPVKGRAAVKRKYSGIFFLIFCLGPHLEAQKNPPKITLVPVAGPVHMLQGGGGNIGIAELAVR